MNISLHRHTSQNGQELASVDDRLSKLQIGLTKDGTPNLGASAHNLIVVWLRKQSAPTAGGES
jgi:hypothetical protein